MRAGVLLLSALACSCHGREVAAPGKTKVLTALVRAAGDAPVPGARVELFPGPAEGELTDEDAIQFRPASVTPQAIATAMTDAQGAAAFDLPAAGRYWVSATAPGMGRGTVGATVVPSGEPPRVELPLVPGHDFTGTVTDERGLPVAGVEVVAAPTWRCRVWPCDAACDHARTDASGSFRFDALAPGEYAIWHRPVEWPRVWFHGPMRSIALADAFVGAGTILVPALEHLAIRTTEGGTMQGVVRDAESGTPLPLAAIRVLDSEDQVIAEGHAAPDGCFALRTHRPECSIGGIAVLAAGYAPTPVSMEPDLPAHLAEGQSLSLDLRLQKEATLRGRLLGPEGPVPGVRIELWKGAQTMTDAAGGYRFTSLDPGTCFVTVDGFDLDSDVEVVAGAETVHDFHIEPEKRVKGRVMDPEGKGVRGAHVWSDEGSQATGTETDAQGWFALLLSPSRRALDVEPPAGSNLGRRACRLDVSEGDVEICLPYRVRIRGIVRRADGSPVPGTRIAATSGQVGADVYFFHFDSIRECLTAADGSYQIGLPERGDYLCVSSPPDGATAWRSLNEDAMNLRVDVTMPKSRWVSGRAVAKGAGAGIEGLRVSLVIAWNASESSTYLQPGSAVCAVTDAEGRFRVPFPIDQQAAIQLTGAGYEPTTAKPGDGDLVVEMVPASK